MKGEGKEEERKRDEKMREKRGMRERETRGEERERKVRGEGEVTCNRIEVNECTIALPVMDSFTLQS